AHRIRCSCFSLHGMLYFVYHVLLLLSRNVARFLPSVSHKIGFPLPELKQLAPIENAPLLALFSALTLLLKVMLPECGRYRGELPDFFPGTAVVLRPAAVSITRLNAYNFQF